MALSNEALATTAKRAVPALSGGRPRGPQLTERDVEILRWITCHGVVTSELVGRRFLWRPELRTYGKRATYRRLAILQSLGLLIRSKPFAQRPEVIRVTEAGARIAGVGLAPAPLVLAELQHTLSIVWLAEYLLAANPGAELTTERELRADRYRERQNPVPARQRRIPDATLRIPAAGAGAQAVRTIAVELDRVRKDERAILSIIRAYDRDLTLDGVWWYVSPGRVQRLAEIDHGNSGLMSPRAELHAVLLGRSVRGRVHNQVVLTTLPSGLSTSLARPRRRVRRSIRGTGDVLPQLCKSLFWSVARLDGGSPRLSILGAERCDPRLPRVAGKSAPRPRGS